MAYLELVLLKIYSMLKHSPLSQNIPEKQFFLSSLRPSVRLLDRVLDVKNFCRAP
ncbi:MAG: hypothetical protein KC548_02280 [Nanoarchaeota archaeon]|nr:hypothetical protein [Nanoarchaeota archaeon]